MHFESIRVGQWLKIVNGPPATMSGCFHAEPRRDNRDAGFIFRVRAIDVPFLIVEVPGGLPEGRILDTREYDLAPCSIGYRRAFFKLLQAAAQPRPNRPTARAVIDEVAFWRP